MFSKPLRYLALLFLLLLPALAHAAFTRPKIMIAPPTQMPNFVLQQPDHTNLRYYVVDPPADEQPKGVMLFIHGLGEYALRHEPLIRQIAEAAHVRVVSFDLRGHGYTQQSNLGVVYGKFPRGLVSDVTTSPRAPPMRLGDVGSFATLMEDCTAVLAAGMRGLPADLPTMVFGHSLGGLIALVFSTYAPPAHLRATIASAPALDSPSRPMAPTIYAAKALRFFGLDSIAIDNGLESSGLSRDPAVAASYEQDPMVHSYVSLRTGLFIFEEGDRLLLNADHQARLAEPAQDPIFDVAKSRLFILHGDGDAITSQPASLRFVSALSAVARGTPREPGAPPVASLDLDPAGTASLPAYLQPHEDLIFSGASPSAIPGSGTFSPDAEAILATYRGAYHELSQDLIKEDFISRVVAYTMSVI
ncbi:hypothetical protein H696_00996 [Fonticula alba]|uniref:Serine aminopeptidase S33 domain-containing protein n=1 Tax=Fonticula alba TaxID=691883 RepID=A0A058ZIY5_FONAL|nr:hypothetical protein H696_00996 [Fonticula alba]KCV73462.1 hypothetical protein H696_00996 [Fonticula alba]|eukprot:XP_009493163.1 hypothetical protein H696_00996 [Fonticula alba]